MKCPNCGSDLPSPTHFGLKASPKNYMVPQLVLTPGKKYLRTFTVLFYPERHDQELGELGSCLVIASEEYPKDTTKSYPFISGSKFYENDMDKLMLASDYVMISQLCFKSYLTGKSIHQLLHNRLRELYHSPSVREELMFTAESILKKMRICAEVTKREQEEKK